MPRLVGCRPPPHSPVPAPSSLLRVLSVSLGRNVPLPTPWSDEVHEGLLRGLFASNSRLAVNMITDIFGTAERFNVPGPIGDQNWTDRFPMPIAEWDKH